MFDLTKWVAEKIFEALILQPTIIGRIKRKALCGRWIVLGMEWTGYPHEVFILLHGDGFMKLLFEKGNRYYVLRLYRDLLGDWVVERMYGNKYTYQSQVKREIFTSHRVARRHFMKLARYRLDKRHYQRIKSE